MAEVRKVLLNKSTGGKYLCIPKESELSPGDMVIVSKMPSLALIIGDATE